MNTTNKEVMASILVKQRNSVEKSSKGVFCEGVLPLFQVCSIYFGFVQKIFSKTRIKLLPICQNSRRVHEF